VELLLSLLCLPQVEGQPLSANAERAVQALEFLGAPVAVPLKEAGRDAARVQAAMDPHVALVATLGGKLERGAAPLVLQQSGWTPLLLKVVNPAGVTKALAVSSPQAGPVYAGVAELSMKRQGQQPLRQNENVKGEARFLDLEVFGMPPMTPLLSGLGIEYVILLVYSTDAGKLEATLVVEGAPLAVAFEARPAIPVKLSIRDVDGAPTTARLTFTDRAGRIHPPQPKRLAPDFFFQKQIYRPDGGTVLLPPGELTLRANRGPEYRTLERQVRIAEGTTLDVRLERWVDAREWGYYSGDHHIHAAGCAHYTSPTQGVHPPDMFQQVKGEGLNVGCVLTWGPSFDYQKRFFSPRVDRLSEPLTLLKYDIEVSGFGSQALGHVCLLNLKEQQYPGSDGSKNWPTWTTPVLRWAKGQGGVTGYAHSASGLQVVPASAGKRLLAELDADRDGRVSAGEAAKGLLPETFGEIDADRDGGLVEAELVRSVDRAADRLPNLAIPEMNSVGAMEMFVTVPQGLCDFISAMDTARLPEWNAWYHVLNCGFPLKVSGETDFPCMSGTRVGQGRVYVWLGRVEAVDFQAWVRRLAEGRSYVSDGYAHALDFAVDGRRPGDELRLPGPSKLAVSAKVAFSPETPAEVPYGALPPEGPRLVGDTVDLRDVRAKPLELRRVDVVVNGRAVAFRDVPADGRVHELRFDVQVERSSWVALRHFPQMHTNPVTVLVGGKPVRASRASALWCIGAIEQLWRLRGNSIAESDRDEARRTFESAIEIYRKIAAEAPE
jgi:hypothetical protein